MTSSINASTAAGGGVITTADASGILALQTAGTTAITIDGSQNVGIGTTPDAKLTIKNPSVTGEQTVLDVHGATNTTRLLYASVNQSTDVNNFGTGYGGALAFVTNSTERGRWNAGAPILCLAGGNTSATGTGIAFPASQSASSDANTLDDYEEGTWTPAITPTTGGSITLKNISAYYTKVGRLVNVWFTAQVNTASTPSGRMGLSGLPFAANTSPIGATCAVNGFGSFSGSTAALIESVSTGNLDIYVSGGISATLANYAAPNAYIFFNATYTTA